MLFVIWGPGGQLGFGVLSGQAKVLLRVLGIVLNWSLAVLVAVAVVAVVAVVVSLVVVMAVMVSGGQAQFLLL